MFFAASAFASNAAFIFSLTIRLLSRFAATPPFASFAIRSAMTAGILALRRVASPIVLDQTVLLFLTRHSPRMNAELEADYSDFLRFPEVPPPFVAGCAQSGPGMVFPGPV